jgi:predicted RNA-binding Zn ribbon-like protein
VPRSIASSIASLSQGRAGRLPLVGGRLCLNFVNTSSGRGTDSHKDHLVAYNDLLAWTHHAEALDKATTLALADLAGRKPAAARRVLARAIKLRETLFAIVTALARKAPPATADLAILNTYLVAANRSARLERSKRGFTWVWSSGPPQLELPLWLIARSAAEVLTAGPLERLKSCNGDSCGWVFLDQTRNGRRRWCEMEVCGSRAKMRRFRARHAAAHAA